MPFDIDQIAVMCWLASFPGADATAEVRVACREYLVSVAENRADADE